MTYDEMKRRGVSDEIPEIGWLPVTVSGGVAGWTALSKRFGKLKMTELMAPVVELAEAHAISDGYANTVNKYIKRYGDENDPLYDEWFRVFAPGRKPLEGGQTVCLHELGETLRRIGETDGEDFYRGKTAHMMADYSESTGGLLRYDDFASYEVEWVDPVSVNYRGYDIWELPPNGQGITPIIALNIMDGFPAFTHDDAMTVHRQIECMKLAFADAFKYISDYRYLKVKVADLLSKEYAAERRKLIGETAITPPPGDPYRGGTVYLCAADGEGNMISLIQSVAQSFGSGVVVPGTGVILQNRGGHFSMNPEHPNVVGPRKRSFNTIIPGFITKDDKPVGPIGVMGGYMQPQGHMQVAMNMIDFGMNPQAALDAPRWFWQHDKLVRLESTWPKEVIEALRARGHEVEINDVGFGRGQIIVRMEDGTLAGGTEPRGGGSILGY